MKTLNQYINEKLVINKNTKINNSHIDEPSINVPENAFKETKDINFHGVKFTYDLTRDELKSVLKLYNQEFEIIN